MKTLIYIMRKFFLMFSEFHHKIFIPTYNGLPHDVLKLNWIHVWVFCLIQYLINMQKYRLNFYMWGHEESNLGLQIFSLTRASK